MTDHEDFSGFGEGGFGGWVRECRARFWRGECQHRLLNEFVGHEGSDKGERKAHGKIIQGAVEHQEGLLPEIERVADES